MGQACRCRRSTSSIPSKAPGPPLTDLSSTAGEHVLTDISESVLTVTLNRPERLNAVTLAMLDRLIEVFQAADADDGVRVVVVTGRGRAFCAGADLSEGAGRFDYRSIAPEAHRDNCGTVKLASHDGRKPYIAAATGA